MMLDPKIVNAEVLKLAPGDILILKIPAGSDIRQINATSEAINLLLRKAGKDNRCMIIPDNVSVMVQSGQPVEPKPAAVQVPAPSFMRPGYTAGQKKKGRHKQNG